MTGKCATYTRQQLSRRLTAHDSGLEIYSPFANLPSRKLEDYYKVIRHPVSIKGVAKRVRGIHGREPPTGITDYKTWDAFEEGVSWIWRNAREYNEDTSDMYALAGEFEVSRCLVKAVLAVLMCSSKTSSIDWLQRRAR